MRKRLSSVLAVSLVAVALAVVSMASAADPIKIGAILPLTGSGASFGVWMKGGTEMAVEEINAAGGIAGHKVEAIFEDHAADASKGTPSPTPCVQYSVCPAGLAVRWILH